MYSVYSQLWPVSGGNDWDTGQPHKSIKSPDPAATVWSSPAPLLHYPGPVTSDTRPQALIIVTQTQTFVNVHSPDCYQEDYFIFYFLSVKVFSEYSKR